MNVSLKNRMGTESHGGDGGLLEDREDGGTENSPIIPLKNNQKRTGAAHDFSPGGDADCGGIAAAAPSEEEERVRTEESASRCAELSEIPAESVFKVCQSVRDQRL